MTNIVCKALRSLVSTAVLGSMLVVGAMSGTRPNEVTQIGVCHDAARCAAIADISQERAEMITDQVNGFSCRPAAKDVIPRRALVLDARAIKKGAEVGGVVSAESFDTAFAHAKAGTVWVLRWCT